MESLEFSCGISCPYVKMPPVLGSLLQELLGSSVCEYFYPDVILGMADTQPPDADASAYAQHVALPLLHQGGLHRQDGERVVHLEEPVDQGGGIHHLQQQPGAVGGGTGGVGWTEVKDTYSFTF